MGGEVVGISVDAPGQNRKLVVTHGLEFLLLSDPNLEAIDLFGVRHKGASLSGDDIARPATFVLDREGRVAWRQLTDNLRIRLRPETVLAELKKIP